MDDFRGETPIMIMNGLKRDRRAEASPTGGKALKAPGGAG
jgi:hypothetical protein